MPKRHVMVVLAFLTVVAIWLLEMPRVLLIMALFVAAILVLNAFFHWVD